MLRNNLEGRVDRCPSAHQKFRRTAGGSVASGHPTSAPWTSCSSGVRNRSRPAMCDGRRCWPKKVSLGKLLRFLLPMALTLIGTPMWTTCDRSIHPLLLLNLHLLRPLPTPQPPKNCWRRSITFSLSAGGPSGARAAHFLRPSSSPPETPSSTPWSASSIKLVRLALHKAEQDRQGSFLGSGPEGDVVL